MCRRKLSLGEDSACVYDVSVTSSRFTERSKARQTRNRFLFDHSAEGDDANSIDQSISGGEAIVIVKTT